MKGHGIVQLHAIFKGKVQGVGFRWTVLDWAEHFKLKGSAKNLNDGTVEVYAQGSQEGLEAFLKAVKNNPGSAKIDHVSCYYQEISNPYKEFKIIF